MDALEKLAENSLLKVTSRITMILMGFIVTLLGIMGSDIRADLALIHNQLTAYQAQQMSMVGDLSTLKAEAIDYHERLTQLEQRRR